EAQRPVDLTQQIILGYRSGRHVVHAVSAREPVSKRSMMRPISWVVNPEKMALRNPLTVAPRCESNHSSKPVLRDSSRPMIDVRNVRQPGLATSPRYLERP